ncbi:MAG: gamma-glutamyltransferase family protein [Planctomycetota bacterium]
MPDRAERIRRLRHRPVVRGSRGAIATGHYLATAAGHRIALEGGNAIDMAAAAGFVLSVVEQQETTPGGEVPVLVYAAAERKVYAISGVGWSPRAFTIGWCREQGIDLIPGDGYLPACVPAVVDTWAVALERFGTMPLAQVLAPAIELAEGGYPMYRAQRQALEAHEQTLRERYPSTCEVYLPGGRVPEVGERVRNRDLAETFRTLCRAEADHAHKGRVAGIEAARDAFYRGPIAERIAEFVREHPVLDASGCERAGLLAYDDLADWRATVEAPVSLAWRGLAVHKCPTWTQGPVLLQQLALLEAMDVGTMRFNSAAYVHARLEAARLAFADREAYYGDPALDDVPLDVLLSRDYAERRSGLVGKTASLALRPGDVGRGTPDYVSFDVRAGHRRALGLPPIAQCQEAGESHEGDTSHLDAVDAEGNMVAATPSGGWFTASPVIRGLGFPLGTRGQMFYLNPARPNALAPRKRPRATLTPTLVTRDGEPVLAFGCRGGDTQDQTSLQLFLAHAHAGLPLDRALDAPTFWAEDFPSSFYPRAAHPGLARVENTLDPRVIRAVRRRGHAVCVADGLSLKLMAVARDPGTGLVSGGVCATAEHAHALAW